MITRRLSVGPVPARRYQRLPRSTASHCGCRTPVTIRAHPGRWPEGNAVKSASGHRYPRSTSHLPRAVRESIDLARRSAELNGPVTVTRAIRCECGAWLRPGVDHDCPGPPIG